MNVDMLYDACFSIILPKRHNFVELLIRKVHYKLEHFGWSFVLAKIQRRFWILRGQSSVRSYLKSCAFCQFKNAKSSSQLMAALPKERLIAGNTLSTPRGAIFLP